MTPAELTLYQRKRRSERVQEGTVKAELKVLRAWFYYILMDYFGGVPIVTTTEVKPAARNTRDEVSRRDMRHGGRRVRLSRL